MRGSPLYMAPEIICQMSYDARVDLWSIGIILYGSKARILLQYGSVIVAAFKCIAFCTNVAHIQSPVC